MRKYRYLFLWVFVLMFAGISINLALSQETEINKGIAWLEANQNTNGSWGETASSTTSPIDATCAVTDAFYYLGISNTAYSNAITWVSEQGVANTRHLALKTGSLSNSGADVTELVNLLVSCQNSDGGWGINKSYASDTLNTALAFRALFTANYSDTTVLENAIAFLISNQNITGTWSLEPEVNDNIYLTAIVILALRDYQLKTAYSSSDFDWAIASGASWLENNQNPDGGFGTSIYETALAYSALIKTTQPMILDNTFNYLLTNQDADGSWDQDAYTTALVLRALRDYQVPPGSLSDLTLSPSDITFNPVSPAAGEAVQILAVVRNQGGSPANNVIVQVFNGDPDTGGAPIGSGLTISSLPAGETTDVLAEISFAAGVYDIYVRIDPDNTVTESDETNNTAFNNLTVTEGVSAPVDLTISSTDITFSPDSPTSIDPVTITAVIHNTGGTLASNILVRVYDGITQLGPDFTFGAIGIGGQTTVELISTLTAGSHDIYVKIDPDNLITESNEENNQASGSITVSSSPAGLADLTLGSYDITFSDPAPSAADFITITAVVHNIGGSDANQVVVQFYDGDPESGGSKLGSDLILTKISAGFTGTANLTGTLNAGTHNIYVKVDPYNTIAESDETNNIDSNSIIVSPSVVILPDLSIAGSDITFSPESPTTSDETTIMAIIHNIGGNTANDVSVQIFDGDPGTGGVQLGQNIVLQAISPGATVTIQAIGTLNEGVHDIYIILDMEGLIAETDETNNQAFNSITVSAAPVVLSDLAISPSDITFSIQTPTEIDPVTISAVIHNTGGSDINDVLARFYDGNPAAGGMQIGPDFTIPFIGIAAEASVEFTHILPEGEHQIFVLIDPCNNIAELDETNNTAFNSIIVLPLVAILADLAVTSADISFSDPAPLVGANITITAAVRNLGVDTQNITVRFYIGDPNKDGAQIGEDKLIPSLFTAEETTVSLDWIIPSAGLHNIYVSVDPDNIIQELKKTNNLAHESLPVSSVFSGTIDVNTDKNEYTANEDVQIGIDVVVNQLAQRFKTWTTKEDWESEGTTSINIDTETSPGDMLISPEGTIPHDAVWRAQFDADKVVDWRKITWNATLPLDPTLVGYWPMDEGEGAVLTDFSEYNNTGAINGAAWTDGKYGKALSFDGNDDYVVVPDTVLFAMTDATFSAWIKTIQNTQGNIVRQNGPTLVGPRSLWGFLVRAGGYAGFVVDWTGYGVKSSVTINDGSWHHIAAVRDAGETLKVYVDGVLNNQVSDSISGIINSSQDLFIGKAIDNTEYFNGVIDEIKIYNRALSAEEVAILWNIPPPQTIIKLRARAANTKENLSSVVWSDYYLTPDSAITSPNNRWLEVEAHLETVNPSIIPILHNLIVGYSDIEDIAIEASTRDYQGNTVYDFEPFTVTDFTLGEIKHYDLSWNTRTIFAGDCQVYGSLIKGREVKAEDTDTFIILPELGINSSVATDKIVYTANETVTILSKVTSQSSNFNYTDLVVRESIISASGAEIFTGEQPVGNLSPGTSQNLKFYWDAGSTAPGDYLAIQKVIFENTIVSQTAADFQITSSIDKTAGLSGQITISPQEINAGEEVAFNCQVTNIGNVDMENLTLKIFLIDPDTEEAVKTYSDTVVSLPVGQSYDKIFTDTISLPMKKYLVVFQAEISGVTIPIANSWLYVKSIPATIVIKPESFNKNTGIFTAFVSFPEGYDVSTITDAICDGAGHESMTYSKGTNQMIIKFRRDQITEVPLDTTFVVIGHFGDGMVFQGTDTIMKIIE